MTEVRDPITLIPTFRERLEAVIPQVFLDSIPPEIIDRLRILDEKTLTIRDELRAIRFAYKIFDYFKDSAPFSEESKRIVILGTLLSDLGKSGPKNADKNTRIAIADIYSIEKVTDTGITLESFLKKNFPNDWGERVTSLKVLGIEPSITMRDFYNLHTQWTKDVLDDFSFDPKVVAAAASHHFIRGINPENIIDEKTHEFRGPYSKNGKYDREEKLVTLLDMYDAYRRRGKKTHQDAVACLKKDTERFKNDEEIASLIEAISEVLKDEQY